MVLFCCWCWFSRYSRYGFFHLASALDEIPAFLNRKAFFSSYLLPRSPSFLKLLFM